MTSTEALVKYYRLLRERGINDSHSGNASVRNDEQLWITPTGACADMLKPWQVIRCRVDGSPCDSASQDLALHRAVYRNNPRARAVLHGHGPHAVALTMTGDDLVPIDLEGYYYFPRVPVIDIEYDEYFARSPELVGRALASHPVAIVRGHGMYAWGEDLNQAYKWICSLELSATVKYLTERR